MSQPGMAETALNDTHLSEMHCVLLANEQGRISIQPIDHERHWTGRPNAAVWVETEREIEALISLAKEEEAISGRSKAMR